MKKRLLKKKIKKNLKRIEELHELEKQNRTILKVDKNGVVQIDFDNPEHVRIHEKWIED